MHIIRVEARGGIGNADTIYIEPIAYSCPCFRYHRLEPTTFTSIHGEYQFALLIHLSACKAQSHVFAPRRPKTEAHSVIRDLCAIWHLMNSSPHAFPYSYLL